MIFTLALGLLAAQQIQLPQSMDLALRDLPRTDSILAPGGSPRATIACDEFNRPDGPVGPDWIQMVGTVIHGNAVWNSNGRNGWMRHTSAAAAHLSAVMELDLLPNPAGSSRSSALIMGENFLTGDSIYVKIQNQTGLAGYSHYAFYRTLLGGSAGGWGGFFAVGFQLDAANDGLHMRVRHDAAGVTILDVDDNLDGLYEYSFDSGAPASNTGYAYGTGCGYGSWGTGHADNWELNGGCSSPFFRLAKSGVCPGLLTLATSGGTANSPVAILHGSAGSFTKPGGVCAGLLLGVANPRLAIMLGANASGAASVSFNAPPAYCGRTVQAVDVASCSASYAIML